MGVLWIAGLGPGGADIMTQETLTIIERADRVILRTAVHPAASGLAARGIDFIACDHYYESGENFQQTYEAIVDYVVSEAVKNGSVCYCVPGHPLVAEATVELLLRKLDQADISVRVLPAVSFLDSVFVMLGTDPVRERLSILDAAPLWKGDRSCLSPLPEGSCLFVQAYDRYIAGELKLALLDEVPPDAGILILHHAGIRDEEEMILCPLAELDHFKRFDHLTSVYLPYYGGDGMVNRLVHAKEAGDTEPQANGFPLDRLVEVFRRLLGPGGCPWDQKQTHETLKPYLVEEADEALEAIDEKDMAHLKEELGDVLMQIVFHCALAEERGDFDLNGVIAGVTEKMIRRHPHVFGDEKAENPEEVMVLWQKIKAEEKLEPKNVKKHEKT